MSVISLKHTGSQETLLLPDRLMWVGEYAWSPVAHEAHRGTDGALLLHVARRQAGRPIELQGTASEAWLPRAAVQQLHAWTQSGRMDFTANEGSGLNSTGGSNPPVIEDRKSVV